MLLIVVSYLIYMKLNNKLSFIKVHKIDEENKSNNNQNIEHNNVTINNNN